MQGNSVCTIVRGRRDHLVNLIHGLNAQTTLPDELVIGYMQPDIHPNLPDTPYPVRHLFVEEDMPGKLPLAKARNAVAKAASYDNLIFQDVDCIASPTLVASYSKYLDSHDGVHMGEVYYLPKLTIDFPLNYDALNIHGFVHPVKPIHPAIMPERITNYGELWGLSFAIKKDTYLRVGGMDEAFTGYGAEETDFAMTLESQDIPLYLCPDARCYHQYHAVHIPPLHHFDDIIRNALLFREKHGQWCMDYWLGQFRDSGFIIWNNAITIVRHPTNEEIAATQAPETARFS